MVDNDIAMNNAAARLLIILQQAAAKTDDVHSVRQVFAPILSPDGDYYAFYKEWINLQALITEVEKQILVYIPTKKARIHLENVRKIKESLAISNIDSKWLDNRGKLAGPNCEVLAMLAICAMDLELVEVELSLDQLEEFRKQVEDLLAQAISSSLPEYIKSCVIEKLIDIQEALSLYRYKGSSVLRKAVEASIASYMINDLGEVTTEDQESLFKRYFEMLRNLSTVLTVVDKGKEYLPALFEQIYKMLPPGN